jgi:hypothetical protein
MSFANDYVDVAARLRKFYEQHPDGRIQSTPPEIIDIAGQMFLGVTSTVWRTPDDPLPCVGTAWEPFPGRTAFTKDSEAMNAETSAMGRALAAAGISVKKIASADEIAHRQPDPPPRPPAPNRNRKPSKPSKPAAGPVVEIPVAEAKGTLLGACQGDRAMAIELWGSRLDGKPVTKELLAEVVGIAEALIHAEQNDLKADTTPENPIEASQSASDRLDGEL